MRSERREKGTPRMKRFLLRQAVEKSNGSGLVIISLDFTRSTIRGLALFRYFVADIKTSKKVLVKDEVDALKQSRAVERQCKLPHVQQEPGDAGADRLRNLIGDAIQAGG